MMITRFPRHTVGFIAALLVPFLAVAAHSRTLGEAGTRSGMEPEPPSATDAALLQRFDLEAITGSGFWNEVRLGDLNGDNRLDLLVAAQRPDAQQNVHALAAIDMDGNLLWRVGAPPAQMAGASYDLPVQVHDFTGDGRHEVIHIDRDTLYVRDGATGAVLRQGPLPDPRANDAIAFADFRGTGRAADLVVKTRYTQVWALDNDFNVLWTYRGTVGHYPWPHDVTGNGRDELVIGHALIAHDGEVLWENELPDHADGVAVADLNGDGRYEIAVATCNGATFNVVSPATGEILWSQPTRHAQHIIVGNFRPDRPGLEVAGLDRGVDRSAMGEDRIIVFADTGEELWREQRTDVGTGRWVSIISRLGNWDQAERDLILAFRRGGELAPELRDGYGNLVARFPFVTNSNRAHHADILGDPRTEVVVWSSRWIYVYGNPAPYEGEWREPDRRAPDPRLYNFTHYTGMP